MSIYSSDFRDIADPIHGLIRLDEEVFGLINDSAIARLKNIKQLGFSYLSFPGAVHTRFEHSIGTYHVLSQMLDSLCMTDPSERLFYLKMSLVSEVGIYPFSYSFRESFTKLGVEKSEMRVKLCEGVLRNSLGLTVDEIERMRRFGNDIPEWFSFISDYEQFSHLNPVRFASKMDYLLRDAYYSGVYSNHIDLRRILSFDSWRTGELRGDELLYLMYFNVLDLLMNSVYADKTRRIYTLMANRLVASCLERRYIDSQELSEPDAFAMLDDDKMFHLLDHATQEADDNGDGHLRTLFSKLRGNGSFSIISFEGTVPDPGDDADEEVAFRAREERKLASRLGKHPESVILNYAWSNLSGGFRVFGKDFDSYYLALVDKDVRGKTILKSDTLDSMRDYENHRLPPEFYVA